MRGFCKRWVAAVISRTCWRFWSGTSLWLGSKTEGFSTVSVKSGSSALPTIKLWWALTHPSNIHLIAWVLRLKWQCLVKLYGHDQPTYHNVWFFSWSLVFTPTLYFILGYCTVLYLYSMTMTTLRKTMIVTVSSVNMYVLMMKQHDSTSRHVAICHVH